MPAQQAAAAGISGALPPGPLLGCSADRTQPSGPQCNSAAHRQAWLLQVRPGGRCWWYVCLQSCVQVGGTPSVLAGAWRGWRLLSLTMHAVFCPLRRCPMDPACSLHAPGTNLTAAGHAGRASAGGAHAHAVATPGTPPLHAQATHSPGHAAATSAPPPPLGVGGTSKQLVPLPPSTDEDDNGALLSHPAAAAAAAAAASASQGGAAPDAAPSASTGARPTPLPGSSTKAAATQVRQSADGTPKGGQHQQRGMCGDMQWFRLPCHCEYPVLGCALASMHAAGSTHACMMRWQLISCIGSPSPPIPY